MVKPYQDTILDNNNRIRCFSCDVDERELVWHQDRRSRLIKVISGTHWKLQLDNKLPVELIPHHIYYIEKEIYHRLIKGDGDLVIEIKEDDS